MSSECITSCNENGCRCQTHRHGLGDVNYVLLASFNGGNIACLCGNFTDLLPLKVVSSTSLVITYNAVSGNENLFIYTSSFNFNAKSYNDLCSPQKHIMEPQGMISSGAVKKRRKKDGKGLNYHHGYCQWFFDVGSQIVLNIKTDTKHYDCSTWNISLIPEWSRNPVSKYIFCPEDVSKEYLLNTSKITLRLSSLSPFPVDYVISWRPLNSSRMEQEFSPTTEDILMSDEEERPPVFKEQKNKGAASAEASSSSSESLLISNKLYLFVLYVRICYMAGLKPLGLQCAPHIQ
ncbi:unnamed protein product [Lepeophtheirus salmonis]|uniref:(salmon louse) hypothetical protein n=1 Tax=Lepeophtheirus salmonis TaxID=72036 RepID=A0A7R8CYQ1_LEPSM|nr:unnamed protein product [Lepeophtheirus salmonis]CAF2970107.1 unnamed protein product [Lepeophtheirus salmonis]